MILNKNDFINCLGPLKEQMEKNFSVKVEGAKQNIFIDKNFSKDLEKIKTIGSGGFGQ